MLSNIFVDGSLPLNSMVKSTGFSFLFYPAPGPDSICYVSLVLGHLSQSVTKHILCYLWTSQVRDTLLLTVLLCPGNCSICLLLGDSNGFYSTTVRPYDRTRCWALRITPRQRVVTLSLSPPRGCIFDNIECHYGDSELMDTHYSRDLHFSISTL